MPETVVQCFHLTAAEMQDKRIIDEITCNLHWSATTKPHIMLLYKPAELQGDLKSAVSKYHLAFLVLH